MSLRPALAVLAIPGMAGADRWSDCFGPNPNDDPDLVISECSELLREAEPSGQRRAKVLVQRGVAWRALGDVARSAEDLEEAVALAPHSGDAKRMLAWTYRSSGRPAAAERLYTDVLRHDDRWQGWLSRCVVRLDLGNPAAAAADCLVALERSPENLDALFFRGPSAQPAQRA